MKRIIVFTSLLLLVLVGVLSFNQRSAPVASALKEGDIVFQTSKSPQSKYIIMSTKSQWSHCGIIVEKPDGLYVLEAINRVSLTPCRGGSWRDNPKDHYFYTIASRWEYPRFRFSNIGLRLAL